MSRECFMQNGFRLAYNPAGLCHLFRLAACLHNEMVPLGCIRPPLPLQGLQVCSPFPTTQKGPDRGVGLDTRAPCHRSFARSPSAPLRPVEWASGL